MERKIEKFLKKWKDDSMKKPLILFGSKQIGKTFSVLDFGKKEYKNMIYFNTDNNKEIINLFTKEKSTEKLILNLSLISGETILKEDTLVILDNLTNNEIAKGFYIQVGSFSKFSPNKELLGTIKDLNFKYSMQKAGEVNRLLIGPFKTKLDAQNQLGLVKERLNKDAFIKEIK